MQKSAQKNPENRTSLSSSTTSYKYRLNRIPAIKAIPAKVLELFFASGNCKSHGHESDDCSSLQNRFKAVQEIDLHGRKIAILLYKVPEKSLPEDSRDRTGEKEKPDSFAGRCACSNSRYIAQCAKSGFGEAQRPAKPVRFSFLLSIPAVSGGTFSGTL